MNFNATMIIWRECIEAILVIGIFFSLLSQRSNFQKTKKYLYYGIIGGVALSSAIAYMIEHAYSELQGLALDYFEIALLLTASIMMTHMCLWMKHNSQKFVGQTKSKFESALSSSKLVTIAALTTIAIAREGAEIAIFLYSFLSQAETASETSKLVLGSSFGFLLAALTGYLYFSGLKKINFKIFFNVTSVFLLMTASSLLLESTRRLMQMDVIQFGVDPFWDTSWIVSDGHWIGKILSTLVGYESQPATVVFIAAVCFWSVSLTLFFRTPKSVTIKAS